MENKTLHNRNWESKLEEGVLAFIDDVVVPSKCIDVSHLKETPHRFVEAFKEYTRGCSVNPASFLKKEFAKGKYDQMIHEYDIEVVSLCAHHWAAILGKAHFAYVPDKYVVGLSKIPRMIDALSHRPQVQENLTDQIVDIFQETVKPKGCAVHIRALHMCMSLRGVRQHGVITETTALRGVFKTQTAARQEFIMSLNHAGPVYP